MISIIVCSVNTDYLQNFKLSLDKTIGVPYELLIWNNRENNIPICSAYNKMATTAKNEILCFIHEDVEFNTINWGQTLIEIFNKENCGVVGVAGSIYKANIFSGWYTGIKDYDYVNITHRTNNIDTHIYISYGHNMKAKEVVSIDGVFIASRKNIWQKIKFNEELLKGFHFYDIDFSIRASEICKIVVSYEVNLTHITTGGNFGTAWVNEAFKFHKFYKQKLPVFVDSAKINNTEIQIANTWLNVLKKHNTSIYYKIKWIQLQKLYLYPELWYSIIEFFLYRPLKLHFLHDMLKKKINKKV